MKSTRSGKIFSPYDVVECDDTGIVDLLSKAFQRSDEEAGNLGNNGSTGTSSKRERTGDQDSDKDDMDITSVPVDDGSSESVHHQGFNPPAASKSEKDKARRRAKRRRQKEREFWECGQQPVPDVISKLLNEADGVTASLCQGNIQDLPTASCGFQALNEGAGRKREAISYEYLVDNCYRIIPWDGK